MFGRELLLNAPSGGGSTQVNLTVGIGTNTIGYTSGEGVANYELGELQPNVVVLFGQELTVLEFYSGNLAGAFVTALLVKPDISNRNPVLNAKRLDTGQKVTFGYVAPKTSPISGTYFQCNEQLFFSNEEGKSIPVLISIEPNEGG